MMKLDHFFENELPKIVLAFSGNASECLKFKFDRINLEELLNHVINDKIFYFKSRYNDFTFLGLGHSQTIKAEEVKEFILKNPELFLTTAFTFEGDPKTSELILPEWIFITKDNTTELHILKNIEYKTFSNPNLLFNLNFDLFHYDPNIAPWTSYEEHPEHDQWTKMIETCDHLFDQHVLEKIVMSRTKVFMYDDPIDPIVLFKAILAKNDTTNSYQILGQSTFGEAFISISPERLFTIEGNQFHSISLAGSTPRGKTQEEDLEFEHILNTSDKLIREHSIVTEEIVKKLSSIAFDIKVSSPKTLKLPYIQHRAAYIDATLNQNTDPVELVSLLHPTPAVGGLPSEVAREKIIELEPYLRNSYAAPIGIISAHYSELAVGIRSAQIAREKLTVFGGAGIVKGSTPEEEWIETGTKMNPYLKVINHE